MNCTPKPGYIFREYTAKPDMFFEILPADWQESIVPYWPAYAGSTRIFVLEYAGDIVCGGLVFSQVSPDTLYYRSEAEKWFDNGYLYLAYIWVPEKFRGRKFGSKWLEFLHAQFKTQKFWLAIEDYNLVNFYSPSGYRLVKEISGEWGSEWIMARQI
ncbi:MAG: hypothetical protein JXB34_12125 [Bacteroidales bacterium]|nr:hypothetical protein [Bacteroidales bacterium]